MPPSIYLASKSPRRRELLTQIGVPFELLLPAEHEDSEAIEQVIKGEAPEPYVKRVVLEKLDAARARLAQRNLPFRPILSADTTVAIGGRIIGKPANHDEAVLMLTRLSGRTHRVLTALAVSHGEHGQRTRSAISVSRVSFGRIEKSDIEQYVALGTSLDKAGGYGVQGPAARFIRKIEGSYSGIMGLPLYEVTRLLRGLQ